jgi:hypothetical protein
MFQMSVPWAQVVFDQNGNPFLMSLKLDCDFVCRFEGGIVPAEDKTVLISTLKGGLFWGSSHAGQEGHPLL